jgi:hypothetical protein
MKETGERASNINYPLLGTLYIFENSSEFSSTGV